MSLNAVSKFLKTGHRRFPVIKKGKWIGQISRMDVILLLHDLKVTSGDRCSYHDSFCGATMLLMIALLNALMS